MTFTTRAKIGLYWLQAFLFGTLLFASPARLENLDGRTAQVQIHDMAFSPAVLTVKAGTEVSFVNLDNMLHSVVARDGSFESGALDRDETFSVTLMSPGEHGYFCGVHAHMTGKIVVVP